MPKVNFKLNIRCYCSACSRELQATFDHEDPEWAFEVTPCGYCNKKVIDAARENGYEEGYDDGKAEAEEEMRSTE